MNKNSDRALNLLLTRALALDYADRFCDTHKLSREKLRMQRFYLMYGSAIFAQPSDVAPDGLINDRATMPIPTLIIRIDGEKLTVETTEHTDKYLRMD